MNRIRKILIVVLGLVMLLTLCGLYWISRGYWPLYNLLYSKQLIAQNLTDFENEKTLSSSVADLIEVQQFQNGFPGNPISGLHFRTKDKILLVSSAGDGYLRGYNLGTDEIELEYQLYLGCVNGVVFDKDGEYIMGAQTCSSSDPDYYFTPQALFQHVGVWTIDDGTLVTCSTGLCNEVTNYDFDMAAYNGFTISNYKEILLLHDSFGFFGGSLTNQFDSYFTSTRDTGKHLAMITFDSTDLWLALAFSEGNIRIVKYSGLLSLPIWLGEVDGQNIEIKDLSFSPDNHYLAKIRGDQLSVWNIGEEELVIEETIPNSHTLEFTPTGDLLFIGTENEIFIMDIDSSLVVARYDSPGLTSLHVGRDNQHIYWGDRNGVVHIWGFSDQM